MIKFWLYIALLFFSFSLVGQEENKKNKVWKSEKEFLQYKKKDKYNGPIDWGGSYPSELEKDEYDYSDYVTTSSSGSRRLNYNPQQIKKDRQKRGFDRGGGGGGLQFDPTVERPDPIEVPDIDPIDIDTPDIDLPDVDLSFSQSLWRVLLFILLFAVLFILAYLIIKNLKPADKKIVVVVEDDWNPEVITKSELELRLDEAIEQENYRECIRIYYTFILKELIRKSWIKWKKEKTNHHYVIEMSKQNSALSFNECVRIYDLVWYGEYYIDNDIYGLLKPSLNDYYQSLNPPSE